MFFVFNKKKIVKLTKLHAITSYYRNNKTALVVTS